jgi:hypothetical protein
MEMHKMEGLYNAQTIKVALPYVINTGINSKKSSKLS